MLKIFSFSIMISMFLIVLNVKAEEPTRQDGLVQLGGELIASSCGIDNDSAEQTVDFGLLAITTNRAEYSQSVANSQKKFYIRLTHCSVMESSQINSQPFDLLLSGTPSHYDSRLLAASGDARGVAIEILDSAGRLIPVGTAVNLQDVMMNNNLLAFNTSLRGFGNQVRAGTIDGMAQFTLRYF